MILTKKELEKDIQKVLGQEFSLDEIKSVMSKYDFDNIIETSVKPKKILLQRLRIQGEKTINQNAEPFVYDRDIFPGVNVWVADNFKGKSTILKLIKWCITGKNDLKPDVKKWISNTMLQFKLGDEVFTVVIDSPSSRVKGSLHKAGITDIMSQEVTTPEFVFSNSTEMTNQLEEFFSNLLGLYTLKWTQKSSKKDSLMMDEATTSWRTYFKALFLKSDEYNSLVMPKDQTYGGQNQKVLGMFLGLNLLKLSNRIGFRIDMIRNEIARQELVEKNKNKWSVEIVEGLKEELIDVNSKKFELEEARQKLIDQTEINSVVNELGKVNTRISNLQQRLTQKGFELDTIEQAILEEESNTIGLKEAMHFKLFFNGINITSCPHCEKKIPNQKIEKEKELHRCRVCDEPLEQSTTEQISFLQGKLEENQKLLDELKREKAVLLKEITNLDLGRSELENSKIKLSATLKQYTESGIDSIDVQIRELLLSQGRIEGKIEELERSPQDKSSNDTNELDREKKILLTLKDGIERKSQLLNKDILNELSTSLKEWVEKFGVKNVDDVIVESNLEPKISQSDQISSFNELVDGEKLRVKIAFYVQLMILANSKGIGRHPQLLMIDSPGTNELIDKDFMEIVNIFKTLDKDHSEDCQILIASARPSLKNATLALKAEVRLNGEPIF